MDTTLMTAPPCRLVIPNHRAYLPLVLHYLDDLAEMLGFTERDRHRWQIALEETIHHILTTAFEPDEQGEIVLCFEPSATRLKLIVHDEGIPYDPSLDFTYDPTKPLEEQSGEGLASFLLQQMVDHYQYLNLGPDGKDRILVKNLPADLIGDQTQPSVQPEIPEKKEPETDVLPDFHIRWMQPNEAIQVSQCVYDSYGYSYAGDYIYYPERVSAMNASGALRSAVAATDNNEIAGHFALIFDEVVPPEVGIAVVKRKYRAGGLARRLADFLEQQADQSGLQGLHAKQVSVHPYTQKFCQKLGYLDCGFLLAHSALSTTFRGIDNQAAQRNTDIIGFKYLQSPKAVTLYLPERHSDWIVRLLERLKVPLTLGTPEQALLPQQQTVMRQTIKPKQELAIVNFSQYGQDIDKLLRQQIYQMLCEGVKVIEVFLDLADPLTPVVADLLEQMNFFFTGIMPEVNGSHAMILQYFNGVELNYEAICVVDDLSKDLLQHIQQLDPYA